MTRDRRLTMTFDLPSNSRADDTRALLILFLNLVDQLSAGKPALPDSAASKLVRAASFGIVFESRALLPALDVVS